MKLIIQFVYKDGKTEDYPAEYFSIEKGGVEIAIPEKHIKKYKYKFISKTLRNVKEVKII